MRKTVQQYDPVGGARMEFCMGGDYVAAADYAAIEAECATLRKRAKVAESEAHQALKTLKGLERVARVVSDNSDQVYGDLNLMKQQRDAALAECERLRDVIRDAWPHIKGATNELYNRMGAALSSNRLVAEDDVARNRFEVPVEGFVDMSAKP